MDKIFFKNEAYISFFHIKKYFEKYDENEKLFNKILGEYIRNKKFSEGIEKIKKNNKHSKIYKTLGIKENRNIYLLNKEAFIRWYSMRIKLAKYEDIFVKVMNEYFGENIKYKEEVIYLNSREVFGVEGKITGVCLKYHKLKEKYSSEEKEETKKIIKKFSFYKTKYYLKYLICTILNVDNIYDIKVRDIDTLYNILDRLKYDMCEKENFINIAVNCYKHQVFIDYFLSQQLNSYWMYNIKQEDKYNRNLIKMTYYSHILNTKDVKTISFLTKEEFYDKINIDNLKKKETEDSIIYTKYSSKGKKSTVYEELKENNKIFSNMLITSFHEWSKDYLKNNFKSLSMRTKDKNNYLLIDKFLKEEGVYFNLSFHSFEDVVNNSFFSEDKQFLYYEQYRVFIEQFGNIFSRESDVTEELLEICNTFEDEENKYFRNRIKKKYKFNKLLIKLIGG